MKCFDLRSNERNCFSDLFETDNVVVCQYDKITRARNKWKFHLKVFNFFVSVSFRCAGCWLCRDDRSQGAETNNKVSFLFCVMIFIVRFNVSIHHPQ